MKVDTAMVHHIARLARLKVEPTDVERMAGQLSRILDYVEQLTSFDPAAADMKDSERVHQPGSCERPDEVTPSLPIERALAAASDATDRAFRVPRILE